MPNRRKTTPDRMSHIHVYLEKKSKNELVTSLLDLVQGIEIHCQKPAGLIW